jgi:hypothetical protein
VVVPALALHRLDQDRRDPVAVLRERGLDLAARAFLLASTSFAIPPSRSNSIAGLWTRGQGNFGKSAVFAGHGVRERHRVARSTVEGGLEVEHREARSVVRDLSSRSCAPSSRRPS